MFISSLNGECRHLCRFLPICKVLLIWSFFCVPTRCVLVISIFSCRNSTADFQSNHAILIFFLRVPFGDHLQHVYPGFGVIILRVPHSIVIPFIFLFTTLNEAWTLFKASILRVAGVVREDNHQIVAHYFLDKVIEIFCYVPVSF